MVFEVCLTPTRPTQHLRACAHAHPLVYLSGQSRAEQSIFASLQQAAACQPLCAICQELAPRPSACRSQAQPISNTRRSVGWGGVGWGLWVSLGAGPSLLLEDLDIPVHFSVGVERGRGQKLPGPEPQWRLAIFPWTRRSHAGK